MLTSGLRIWDSFNAAITAHEAVDQPHPFGVPPPKSLERGSGERGLEVTKPITIYSESDDHRRHSPVLAISAHTGKTNCLERQSIRSAAVSLFYFRENECHCGVPFLRRMSTEFIRLGASEFRVTRTLGQIRFSEQMRVLGWGPVRRRPYGLGEELC